MNLRNCLTNCTNYNKFINFHVALGLTFITTGKAFKWKMIWADLTKFAKLDFFSNVDMSNV